MAYYAPFASETLYDPAKLVDAPLVQDFLQDGPQTYVDYNAFVDYDSYFQATQNGSQFCVDSYQAATEGAANIYSSPSSVYPPANHYSMAPSMSASQTTQISVTPSFLDGTLDAWFSSQFDKHVSPRTVAPASLSASPDAGKYRHAGRVSSHTPVRSSQPVKRKADDSDYEYDSGTSSDGSEYTPHRPAKRPATASKAAHSPLPESLQPIRVQSSTIPRCPMPGCGVPLEAKDSTWRGHFKRAHHDELCLTPNCRSLVAGSCKARCPFPIPDCKSCASDEGHKHAHSGKKGAGGAMTIESVGRHLLNVHIKVAYRCPLCGLKNEWRESACARHIRRCVEKHGNKPGEC